VSKDIGFNEESQAMMILSPPKVLTE